MWASILGGRPRTRVPRQPLWRPDSGRRRVCGCRILCHTLLCKADGDCGVEAAHVSDTVSGGTEDPRHGSARCGYPKPRRTVGCDCRLHRQVEHLNHACSGEPTKVRRVVRPAALPMSTYVAVVHVPARLRRQERVPRLLGVRCVGARGLHLVDVHASSHGFGRLHRVLGGRDDGPAALPDGPPVRDVVVTDVLHAAPTPVLVTSPPARAAPTLVRHHTQANVQQWSWAAAASSS